MKSDKRIVTPIGYQEAMSFVKSRAEIPNFMTAVSCVSELLEIQKDKARLDYLDEYMKDITPGGHTSSWAIRNMYDSDLRGNIDRQMEEREG